MGLEVPPRCAVSIRFQRDSNRFSGGPAGGVKAGGFAPDPDLDFAPDPDNEAKRNSSEGTNFSPPADVNSLSGGVSSELAITAVKRCSRRMWKSSKARGCREKTPSTPIILLCRADRQNDRRAELKLAGNGGINARVGSGVDRLHDSSGTNALTGKSKSRAQRDA